MKTSIYYWVFAIAAWASFIVSFCLPAFDQIPGWKAASLQNSVWQFATQGNVLAVHYLLLTLANLVMLVSPFFIFRGAVDALFVEWLRGLSVGAAVLVLLFPAEFPAKLGADHIGRDLGVGYFLWAMSFVLLCAAALLQAIPPKEKASEMGEKPGG